MSAHANLKTRNQSVSTANSGLDNDGNHNGGGYQCDGGLLLLTYT